MSNTLTPQAQAWLGQLAQQLEDLQTSGVHHLNVAPKADWPEVFMAENTQAWQQVWVDADAGALSIAPKTSQKPSPPLTRDPKPVPLSKGMLPRELDAHPAKEPVGQSLAAVPPVGRSLPLKTPIVSPSATNPWDDRPLSEVESLESLLVRFRNCTRCGLAATRNRLVFGVGNPKPRLLFLGEGPGADEDLQGLPFVGRAGQLLTLGIHALGLGRGDVYITNVVKCRPPENREPHADEVAACHPIFQRQLELLNPALIVTLGNVPLKTLHPAASGITKARGQMFEYGNWPVLPTFHPAYLLRNPRALDTWWLDLKSAQRMAYKDLL